MGAKYCREFTPALRTKSTAHLEAASTTLCALMDMSSHTSVQSTSDSFCSSWSMACSITFECACQRSASSGPGAGADEADADEDEGAGGGADDGDGRSVEGLREADIVAAVRGQSRVRKEGKRDRLATRRRHLERGKEKKKRSVS